MKVPPVQTPRSPSGQEVDLHLHTRDSDGALSERQVIDLVRANAVAVAAITDHDRTEAPRDPVLARYLAELGEAAPQIVPGVEITCALEAPLEAGGSREVHIIGLGCNPRHPGLRKALIRLRRGQEARLRAGVEKLRADGYAISWGQMGRAAGVGMPTAATIAKLLVEAGYASSVAEAKNELVLPRLASGGDGAQRWAMETREAIGLIREAGGVAILAHPNRNVPSHDPATLGRLFATLGAQGLDGAEAYRHGLDAGQRLRYADLIAAAGLLVSGGSDFHGLHRDGVARAPGDADAPLALWGPLEALIRERGGVTDLRDLTLDPAPGANAAERLLLGGP